MSDPSESIADIYPVLVGDVQQRAVAEADRAREEERTAAAALRQQRGDQGFTASELIAELEGDNEEKKQAKLNAALDKINQEAAAEVAAKEKANAGLADSRFPPPIITAGT